MWLTTRFGLFIGVIFLTTLFCVEAFNLARFMVAFVVLWKNVLSFVMMLDIVEFIVVNLELADLNVWSLTENVESNEEYVEIVLVEP